MKHPLVAATGLLAIAMWFVAFLVEADWVRLVTKPLPVLALIPFAVAGSVAGRPLAVGLACGAMGDVLLELGLFVPGLVAFLLGHIAYVSALARDTRRWRLSFLPVFLLYSGTLLALLWSRLGPMRAPVAVYALSLTALLWRAAVRCEAVAADPARATKGALGLVGAVSFAFSDSLIAVTRFHGPFVGARPLILVTYWVAQALLVASLGSDPEPRSGRPLAPPEGTEPRPPSRSLGA